MGAVWTSYDTRVRADDALIANPRDAAACRWTSYDTRVCGPDPVENPAGRRDKFDRGRELKRAIRLVQDGAARLGHDRGELNQLHLVPVYWGREKWGYTEFQRVIYDRKVGEEPDSISIYRRIPERILELVLVHELCHAARAILIGPVAAFKESTRPHNAGWRALMIACDQEPSIYVDEDGLSASGRATAQRASGPARDRAGRWKPSARRPSSREAPGDEPATPDPDRLSRRGRAPAPRGQTPIIHREDIFITVPATIDWIVRAVGQPTSMVAATEGRAKLFYPKGTVEQLRDTGWFEIREGKSRGHRAWLIVALGAGPPMPQGLLRSTGFDDFEEGDDEDGDDDG